MTVLRTTVLLLVSFWIGSAWAQEAPAPKPKPFGPRSHFESDPEPVPAKVEGNPLDWAAARTGIDVRNFELPRGHEGAYRFAARFPIIDSVSNRPLYMPQWAEETADRINGAHREKGLGAVPVAASILRGTAGVKTAPGAEQEGLEGAENALKAAPFTRKYAEALMGLVRGFAAARRLALGAQSDLSKEDRDFFDANPGYFLVPDGKTMPSITGNVDTHFDFIERARKVRFENIFLAANLLVGAVTRYIEATRSFGARDFFEDAARSGERTVLDTPAGRFVIAGTGNDVHEKDADMLIDLGGRDEYRNNAGGCDSTGDGAALCLDHEGHDHYSAPKRRFVQGFGFLGVGILADLGGDDAYEAEHFAQGAGILGVGALWDPSGNDRYVAHAFCQGAGLLGLGILLDGKGDDFYDCATLGQGAASTLGLGVVSDLEGDDRYHLNIGADKDALGNLAGYGQGGALSFRHMPWRNKLTAYGGAGVLLDAAGNDRYRTKGWCDQGGSYIMSLGALVDDGGNDHYSSNTGQGSGIHITNAILIDRDGNDVYEGGFRTGASGGDRSPGFLIDYRGDDVYRPRTSSYGTGCKPFGLSLFIDYEGRDTYECGQPKGEITFNNWDSFGGVWPESEPDLWPYALCLDLGGSDAYRVRNRRNDSERHSFGHGIHLDMEWKGGDVIGKAGDPMPPYRELPLPGSVEASPHAGLFRSLQDPDLFLRFRAVGKIVRIGATLLPLLADALVESEHRSYTRDLHECVHYLLSQGKVGEEQAPHFLRLLNSKDPELRIITADDAGFWKIPGAEGPLLARAKNDADSGVRRFALRSLLALESKDGLALARVLALEDPSESVRRTAVRYVLRVRDEADPGPLLVKVLAVDSASGVRVEAAEGLGELGYVKAADPLLEAARGFDVYVQRAAARALAGLGRVEGIEILIHSMAFPSIDVFFNYNRNVPNDLAAFTGHDFPEEERYDRKRWLEWFEENRDRIDIEANVRAHKAFTALARAMAGLEPEDQVEKYEAFLNDHPAYLRAKKEAARVMNQVAWSMVTAPRGSDAFKPEKGLAIAKRCVELDPHPNYVDTLAEAHFAAGDLDGAEEICRDMLKKHPGERMFLDRLKRIGEARKGK